MCLSECQEGVQNINHKLLIDCGMNIGAVTSIFLVNLMAWNRKQSVEHNLNAKPGSTYIFTYEELCVYWVMMSIFLLTAGQSQGLKITVLEDKCATSDASCQAEDPGSGAGFCARIQVQGRLPRAGCPSTFQQRIWSQPNGKTH